MEFNMAARARAMLQDMGVEWGTGVSKDLVKLKTQQRLLECQQQITKQ